MIFVKASFCFGIYIARFSGLGGFVRYASASYFRLMSVVNAFFDNLDLQVRKSREYAPMHKFLVI